MSKARKNKSARRLVLNPDVEYQLEVCQQACLQGNHRLAEKMIAACLKTLKQVERKPVMGIAKIDPTANQSLDCQLARQIISDLAKMTARAPSRSNISPIQEQTPESKARQKRRRDPLTNMKLNFEQKKTAIQIRDIIETTEILGFPLSSVDYTQPVVDISPKPSGVPMVYGHELEPVYRNWVSEQRETLIAVGQGGAFLTPDILIRHLLIDMYPSRTIEKRFNMRNGSISYEFKLALNSFYECSRALYEPACGQQSVDLGTA